MELNITLHDLIKKLPEFSGRLLNNLIKHSNSDTSDSLTDTLSKLSNCRNTTEITTQALRKYYETGNTEFLLDLGLVVLAIETAHTETHMSNLKRIKLDDPGLEAEIFTEELYGIN